MLLLTRRLGEKITIGDNVTVTVVSINGNQIRLGIDAPRHILVNREECATPEKTNIQIVYRRACM